MDTVKEKTDVLGQPRYSLSISIDACKITEQCNTS